MASKNSKSNLSATAKARLKEFEAKQQLQGKKATRRSRDNRTAVIASIVVVALALGSQLAFFNFGPGAISPTPSAIPTGSATPSSSASNTPSATPSVIASATATADSTPTATTNAEAAACLSKAAPAGVAKGKTPVKVPSSGIAEARTWTGSMYVNGCKLSISLDGVHAPQAAANFIGLAKVGYFNNVPCHRLTTAGIYVLQCGDPTGTGSGGPGYSFGPNNENVPEGAGAAVTYKAGTIAMANSGGTATQGSQFFIVYADSQLAPAYSVFGSVTSGIESIVAIAAQGTANGTADGAPRVATDLGPIVLK